mmetsp:Transcript_4505/g.9654  ORF Transcript_4505/g.9654 Transcript_4505/m.9654 type:complete len:92 (-) Transcript_4505:302-577(-)
MKAGRECLSPFSSIRHTRCFSDSAFALKNTHTLRCCPLVWPGEGRQVLGRGEGDGEDSGGGVGGGGRRAAALRRDGGGGVMVGGSGGDGGG